MNPWATPAPFRAFHIAGDLRSRRCAGLGRQPDGQERLAWRRRSASPSRRLAGYEDGTGSGVIALDRRRQGRARRRIDQPDGAVRDRAAGEQREPRGPCDLSGISIVTAVRGTRRLDVDRSYKDGQGKSTTSRFIASLAGARVGGRRKSVGNILKRSRIGAVANHYFRAATFATGPGAPGNPYPCMTWESSRFFCQSPESRSWTKRSWPPFLVPPPACASHDCARHRAFGRRRAWRSSARISTRLDADAHAPEEPIAGDLSEFAEPYGKPRQEEAFDRSRIWERGGASPPSLRAQAMS